MEVGYTKHFEKITRNKEKGTLKKNIQEKIWKSWACFEICYIRHLHMKSS